MKHMNSLITDTLKLTYKQTHKTPTIQMRTFKFTCNRPQWLNEFIDIFQYIQNESELKGRHTFNSTVMCRKTSICSVGFIL